MTRREARLISKYMEPPEHASISATIAETAFWLALVILLTGAAWAVLWIWG